MVSDWSEFEFSAAFESIANTICKGWEPTDTFSYETAMQSPEMKGTLFLPNAEFLHVELMQFCWFPDEIQSN